MARALVFALLLLAAYCSAADVGCSLLPEELRELRLGSLKRWTEKVSLDLNGFFQVANELMTDDHTFTVLQVGTFQGKQIAMEYGQLLYLPAGNMPPTFHLQAEYDPVNVEWINDQEVVHTYTLNISKFDPTQGQYLPALQGARSKQYLRFEDCSGRLTHSLDINDDQAQMVFESTQGLTPRETICGMIMQACPVGTPLQQYASIEECIAFMYSIPYKSVCPYALTSNTVSCRLLHTVSSFFNPQVHCVHTAPVSPVCIDTCLPACANCDPVGGTCAATFRASDPTTPVYRCQCREGFYGDGQQCQMALCQSPSDCHAISLNRATCDASPLIPPPQAVQLGIPLPDPSSLPSVCGCSESFNWNGTNEALKTGTSCRCKSNERVYYAPGTKQPECVPLGRCRERWQCPADYNTVQCIRYGVNPFDDLNSCICNPGFVGGWEGPCKCFPPRTAKWERNNKRYVCLLEGECTENRHCPRNNKCIYGFKETIGKCVAV